MKGLDEFVMLILKETGKNEEYYDDLYDYLLVWYNSKEEVNKFSDEERTIFLNMGITIIDPILYKKEYYLMNNNIMDVDEYLSTVTVHLDRVMEIEYGKRDFILR